MNLKAILLTAFTSVFLLDVDQFVETADQNSEASASLLKFGCPKSLSSNMQFRHHRKAIKKMIIKVISKNEVTHPNQW